MKLYRIQVRIKDLYFNGLAEGSTIEEAKDDFANKIKNGQIIAQKNSVSADSRYIITYEEIDSDRNITVSIAKKDQLGIQVEPVVS
jgi:hypothetical protein